MDLRIHFTVGLSGLQTELRTDTLQGATWGNLPVLNLNLCRKQTVLKRLMEFN